MTDRVTVTATAVWPDDAEDIDAGVVANWFVRVGAAVEEGETICEIQVEKVSVDIPAPVAGTLAEVLVEENEEFERDAPLAVIDPA